MSIVSWLFNNTITLKQSGVRVSHPKYFYDKSKFKYYEHDQGDGKWKVFVSGDRLDITGTKNDDDISYYGNKSKIDLKEGHDTIFVQGSENEINNPAIVELNGSENEVYAKKDAQISIAGDDNTVCSDLDEKEINIKNGTDNVIYDQIHETEPTTTTVYNPALKMAIPTTVTTCPTVEIPVKYILNGKIKHFKDLDEEDLDDDSIKEIIDFVKKTVKDNGKNTQIEV